MNKQQTYTDHSDINLSRYFADIKTFKPLPAEEQQALAKAAQSGDKKARKHLIDTNLAFVVTVANAYKNDFIDVKDLIEAGNIGLMMAVDAFDCTRGCAFLTYACYMITKYIRTELANSFVVHIPDYVYRETQEGNFVSLDEEELRESLEAGEDFRADYACEHESEMERICAAIGSLPDKKAHALGLLFGLEDGFEHAPEVVADELNISRERVRQIKEESLKALFQKLAA